MSKWKVVKDHLWMWTVLAILIGTCVELAGRAL